MERHPSTTRKRDWTRCRSQCPATKIVSPNATALSGPATSRGLNAKPLARANSVGYAGGHDALYALGHSSQPSLVVSLPAIERYGPASPITPTPLAIRNRIRTAPRTAMAARIRVKRSSCHRAERRTIVAIRTICALPADSRRLLSLPDRFAIATTPRAACGDFDTPSSGFIIESVDTLEQESYGITAYPLAYA